MNDQNKAEVVRLARKGLRADLIAVRINDSSKICMDECVSVEEVQAELDRLTDAAQPWEMAKRAAQERGEDLS